MDITRWPVPKSDLLLSLQRKMEKLYSVGKNKRGADCGSDHEFLIAKFRLKLKKVGKTTRPFSYDLNQIPHNFTVSEKYIQGIRSHRVPEEVRTEVHNIIQDAVIKIVPKRKKRKKAKWLSEEALQIAEKKREAKGKGKYIPI